MKKNITHLTVLIFLLIACNQGTGKNEKRQQVKSEPLKKEFEFPNEFYGQWLNKAYVDKLIETKSTKKSQDASNLCLVNIKSKGDSTIMETSWNFHEGGDSPKLIMIAKNKATSISQYEWSDPFIVALNSDKTINIKYDEKNNNYVKFGEGTKYTTYKEVVNEVLFSGSYRLNDSIDVEFFNSGKVSGLGDYIHYETNIDYMDAGMNYDKIYLTLNNESESTFGYEIRDLTLEIFQLGCKEFDPQDSTYCYVHTREETLYELKRK